MGYGKFEYTWEGVNQTTGVFPLVVPWARSRVIELSLQRSDQFVIGEPSGSRTIRSHSMQRCTVIWMSLLSALLFLVPPPIRFVPCLALQHPVTDPCNIAGDSMPRIMLSYTLSEEMIVILTHRIVSSQSCKGSSLVHGLQSSAVPWFSPTVAAASTELFMLDQPAVPQVLSCTWKSPRIHDAGQDLHRSNAANPRNTFLETWCLLCRTRS